MEEENIIFILNGMTILWRNGLWLLASLINGLIVYLFNDKCFDRSYVISLIVQSIYKRVDICIVHVL